MKSCGLNTRVWIYLIFIADPIDVRLRYRSNVKLVVEFYILRLISPKTSKFIILGYPSI